MKPEELSAYMSGARLTGYAREIIPTLLAGRQGELESWLGYSIEADQPNVTETISVNREGRLMVSSWPIAEVVAVATGDGTVLEAGGTDGTYRYTGDGDFLINGQVFDATGYTVTYRPGLPPNPFQTARVKIMQVVEREVTSLHDDSRDRDGTTRGRRRNAPAIGWQTGEMKALSRWKRRTVYNRPKDYLPGVAPDGGTTYGGAGTEIGGIYTVTNPAAIEGGDARGFPSY